MCAYSEWSNLARSLQQQNKHQGQHMKVHVKGSPPHFQEQVGRETDYPTRSYFILWYWSHQLVYIYIICRFFLVIFHLRIEHNDNFYLRPPLWYQGFLDFLSSISIKNYHFFNSSLTIGIYKSIVQCCLSVIYVLKYYLVPYSMELDVNLFKASIKLLLDFWIIGEINPFTLRRPCTKSGED